MTSISAGNGITMGDVGAGAGGAALAAVTAPTVGVAAGLAYGFSVGGYGPQVGLIGGRITGIGIGAGAALAIGGTIIAMRGNDRDITKPGAITGAIGGGLGGVAAARYLQGGIGPTAAAAAAGAVAGGLMGAGLGSMFD